METRTSSLISLFILVRSIQKEDKDVEINIVELISAREAMR